VTNSTSRRFRALVVAGALAVSVTVTSAPAVADTTDTSESTITQSTPSKGDSANTRKGVNWLGVNWL
jgi:hypothetical protein